MKILAVIPARGGSKGLLRKNVLPLAGKPLIAHSIAAAKLAGCIDRIIVSTDDAEIAAVAAEYGAEVPFIRPSALADDTASGTAVAIHAIEHLIASENYRPDLVLFLQPTSPLRSGDDIRAAVNLGTRQGLPVIGLKPVTQYPQWMKRIGGDGRIHPLFPDLAVADTRQELPASYLVNGAIYLTTTDFLLEHRSFHEPAPLPYLMPAERSVDIDTLSDFALAEHLLEAGRG